MNTKELFTEERAVSPVIGVILMVAITVILAAVIGTFVIGLGDGVGDTAPSASIDSEKADGFDDDYSSGADLVVFTHRSGDGIDPSNLEVAGNFQEDVSVTLDTSSVSGDFSAGDQVTAQIDTAGDITEGDTVRLVYNDGDRSTTLETFEFDEGYTQAP